MRLRLFLSFALITIITLVVLAVVIQNNTQTTITSFAKSGGFLGADRIVNQLAAYYQENGSWDDVSSQLTLGSGQNFNGQKSENSQGQGMGMGQGRGPGLNNRERDSRLQNETVHAPSHPARVDACHRRVAGVRRRAATKAQRALYRRG